MAENIFQGAKRIKEETEEVLNALEGVKKLRDDLKVLSNAFTQASTLKTELEDISSKIHGLDSEINNKIGNINRELNDLRDRTEKMVENQVQTAMEWWKLWALYIPATVLFISLIWAGYIYLTSIRTLKEENEILQNRIISIYHAQVLEDKYWYDKKNKKLFLQDYKWIEEQIKKERESDKKK